MSDAENEKKVHGMVAEFDSVETLLPACRRIRDAGYIKTDAFTPFAVHGIDKALGIKPTVLPWIALGGGLTGTTIALVMQIWMNGIDYPYIISGKPYISLPAFMPVAFELTILLASFGAFFGMWALNGLPKFSNPMFTDPRFDRATDDRFFLFIDAKDDRYDAEGVKNLLADAGGEHVKEVVDDDSPKAVPKFLITAIASVIALSIIPALIVAKMRVTNSGTPRFHIFYDMDFSPAKGAQSTSSLFADSRSMRPDVPGTVKRGDLGVDMDFMTGIDMEKLSMNDAPRAQRLVRAMLNPLDDDLDAGADEVAAETNDAADGAEKKAPADKKEDKKKPDESEKAKEDKKPTEEKAAKDEPAAEAGDDDKAKMKEETGAAKKEEPPAKEENKPAAKPAKEKASDKAMAPADKKEAEESVATEPESPEDTTPWLTENPLDVDEELVRAGQLQFKIYCSVCHGIDGSGNGLVNQRARKILASSWIPPSSLHQETLYQDKYPDGKLFSTITNGIRKMPGYGSQIKAADRWAIVAYVRALQQSQNASIDMIPENLKTEIQDQKNKIDEQLRLQAEAERLKEEERAKKADA